jgi:hypothetical protein
MERRDHHLKLVRNIKNAQELEFYAFKRLNSSLHTTRYLQYGLFSHLVKTKLSQLNLSFDCPTNFGFLGPEKNNLIVKYSDKNCPSIRMCPPETKCSVWRFTIAKQASLGPVNGFCERLLLLLLKIGCFEHSLGLLEKGIFLLKEMKGN